jgi:hypothetical protein
MVCKDFIFSFVRINEEKLTLKGLQDDQLMKVALEMNSRGKKS